MSKIKQKNKTEATLTSDTLQYTVVVRVRAAAFGHKQRADCCTHAIDWTLQGSNSSLPSEPGGISQPAFRSLLSSGRPAHLPHMEITMLRMLEPWGCTISEWEVRREKREETDNVELFYLLRSPTAGTIKPTHLVTLCYLQSSFFTLLAIMFLSCSVKDTNLMMKIRKMKRRSHALSYLLNVRKVTVYFCISSTYSQVIKITCCTTQIQSVTFPL